MKELLELIELIQKGRWISEHGDYVETTASLHIDLEALAARIRDTQANPGAAK